MDLDTHACLNCDVYIEIFFCMIVDTLAQPKQHNIILPAVFQVAQQPIGALLNGHNEREQGFSIGCAKNRYIAERWMIHEVRPQQCQ